MSSTETYTYSEDGFAHVLTANEAREMMGDIAPVYRLDPAIKAEMVAAEAEALEAIAAHAATIRRLSAELRVSQAETARLRDILKMRGVRA